MGSLQRALMRRTYGRQWRNFLPENKPKELNLPCSFCKAETPHLDLGEDLPLRFKCSLCGEYNKTAVDSCR